MPKTHHGSGASPILVGDLLILNHDAMQGGYLLALHRETGKEVWEAGLHRWASGKAIPRRSPGTINWCCIGPVSLKAMKCRPAVVYGLCLKILRARVLLWRKKRRYLCQQLE